MSLSSLSVGRTLVSIPDAQPLARWAWATLLVVIGVGVLALTAQIRVPVPGSPVPITGQTLGVLLLAAAYGSRLGSTSVAAYLAVGIAGVPIFQNGGAGMAVINGPTGGYLIGFLVAAWIVGELAESRWDRVWYLTIAAMVLGNIVIYMCGVTHLAGIVGWERVWALGVAPFLIGDAIKIAIAAAALPTAWKLMERGAPRS